MSRIRKRITFLFEDGDPRISSGFNIDDDSRVITTAKLDVPRHDRITLPLETQDTSVQRALSGQKVYITWSSSKPYFRNVPFKTVVEPGWHIMTDLDSSLSPLDSWFKFNVSDDIAVVTPNWKSVFVPGGLDLLEPDILLSKLSLPAVESVDSLIISYGSLPMFPLSFQEPTDLVIETYASKAPQSVIQPIEQEKIEVGMFSVSKDYSDLEQRDWALAGVLKNFDEQKFQKTMIHAWPRHVHNEDSTFKAYFSEPVGLHPHFILEFDKLIKPKIDGSCKLYAELTIPKTLFLDVYQLADLERAVSSAEPSGKLIGAWGETDLEAPVWGVNGWGSEALIEIYPSNDSLHSGTQNNGNQNNGQFTFELPMHSRYELPIDNNDGQTVANASVPWPTVFWACKDELNYATPDFKGLGYPSFFPDDTVFYYISGTPDSGSDSGSADATLDAKFHVPVAPLEKYGLVQNFTLATIVLGFLYILYKVVSMSMVISKRQQDDEEDKDKDKEPVAARTRSHLKVTEKDTSESGLARRTRSSRAKV